MINNRSAANLRGHLRLRAQRRHRQAFAVKPENAAPSVTLNSFIISNTFSHDMKHQWTVDKAGMETRHILFQDGSLG